MNLTLTEAATFLCRAGLDALQLIGEAYAIETMRMKPAPPRAKHLDGWIDGRRTQVKTMTLTGKDFFGRISRWEEIDDVLFVGANRDTFEVERVLHWDVATARRYIETQPPSYWRGKSPGHFLTERLFLAHAGPPA